MGMTTNKGLIKTYTAGGTITKRRFVKYGATDGVVIQASAATDLIIGSANELGSATGERQDVMMTGNIAEIDAGGTIARGASITSNGTGQAVTAATGNIAAGFAEVSGVSGDVITYVVHRHVAA